MKLSLCFRLKPRLRLGQGWQDSSLFPRVTLCDFKVKQLANEHEYTVQCVLMINMLNEKIYLFLWYWLFLTTCATLINLFYCLIFLILPNLWQKSRPCSRGINLLMKIIAGSVGKAIINELIDEFSALQ